LHGTLRNPNGLRQLLIANLYRPVSTSLFGSQPQIHQEADWSPVVADEVAQEYVNYVIVKRKHHYTD
jgi:hypothetical protein